ncbi:MAG: class I SAM-dependent methyltransferase [Bacteroidota bacterium]
MNKLSKVIIAFGLILRKPYLLNLINDNEEVMKAYVVKKYQLADGLNTVSIDHFIDKEEDIFPYSFLEGSSLPTDFTLLKSICKKNLVEDYLEIGTWRGESVANVAPYVKNCYSINLPDNDMRKLGFGEDYVGMHRYFSKDMLNITHIQANSQTFDFSLLNKKFDLIFLDGDHHTESITNDTRNAFQLLKDDNSMIVWHDYGMGTETTRFSVLAGILDGCTPENIKYLYKVSHSLCAIYTRNEMISQIIKPNSKPEFSFKVKISISK